MPVSINQQIEEVERELEQRRKVFPRLVAARRYTQSETEFFMNRMEAVLGTLNWCRDNRDDCVAFIKLQKDLSNASDQNQDREPPEVASNAQGGRDRI